MRKINLGLMEDLPSGVNSIKRDFPLGEVIVVIAKYLQQETQSSDSLVVVWMSSHEPVCRISNVRNGKNQIVAFNDKQIRTVVNNLFFFSQLETKKTGDKKLPV